MLCYAKARALKNNIGTGWDNQALGMALFANNVTAAREVADADCRARVDVQVAYHSSIAEQSRAEQSIG